MDTRVEPVLPTFKNGDHITDGSIVYFVASFDLINQTVLAQPLDINAFNGKTWFNGGNFVELRELDKLRQVTL
jgi:hypothetical protein